MVDPFGNVLGVMHNPHFLEIAEARAHLQKQLNDKEQEMSRAIDEIQAQETAAEEQWQASLERWFPGGPGDPQAAVVRLHTRRIELWSLGRGVMPAPQGLRAAVVERSPGGWTVRAG